MDTGESLHSVFRFGLHYHDRNVLEAGIRASLAAGADQIISGGCHAPICGVQGQIVHEETKERSSSMNVGGCLQARLMAIFYYDLRDSAEGAVDKTAIHRVPWSAHDNNGPRLMHDVLEQEVKSGTRQLHRK